MKETSKKLDERIFWMNRNREGLYESGYPLTEEQLRSEFSSNNCGVVHGYLHFNPDEFFDTEDFLSGNTFEEYEGSYAGDDTFTIYEVKDEGELYSLMTWEGFDPEESHASGSLNEEYPYFVDESLQCSRYIYEFTGYTSQILPTSNNDNPTVKKYMSKFGLKTEDIEYTPTAVDIARKELSEYVHNGRDVSPAFYEEFLNEWRTKCSEPGMQMYKRVFDNALASFLTEKERVVSLLESTASKLSSYAGLSSSQISEIACENSENYLNAGGMDHLRTVELLEDALERHERRRKGWSRSEFFTHDNDDLALDPEEESHDYI